MRGGGGAVGGMLGAFKQDCSCCFEGFSDFEVEHGQLLSNGKFPSRGSVKLRLYEEAMCSFSLYLNASKFPGHLGILDLAMTLQQDTLIDLDFASKYVTKPMKAMSQETS